MKQKPSFHHPILKCITSFIPLPMHPHKNNLKTKATLLSFWTLLQCLCLWKKSWTAHLKPVVANLKVICDYAGMEQKMSSSNLPDLLHLVYVIENLCNTSTVLNLILLHYCNLRAMTKENQMFMVSSDDTLCLTHKSSWKQAVCNGQWPAGPEIKAGMPI